MLNAVGTNYIVLSGGHVTIKSDNATLPIL